MDNQNFMIMIGGIVGAVVVIIIIVQTIIIIYYKKRVALRTLSHLEQRPAMRRDDRMNNNPPPNIKNRQPMPLPHHLDDTDDEDSIYNAMLEVKLSDLKKNAKQRGGRTLSRIFTPAPPSLDTLPKRVNTNFDDMEDYVYAGSDSGSTISRGHLGKTPTAKIDMRDNIPMAKVNSRPVPPKPVPPKPVPPKPSVVATRPSPGAGAPVMSELGNILKKRNDFNARAVEQPPFEEIASPIHQQHMRPTPKDYPPQQTRAPGFRGPQDRVDREHRPWSPTKPFHHQNQPAMRAYDPRHQVPRQPIDQDKWPSETSRSPQEDRLPSEPPRYPQERRPSEGRVLGRTPNMKIQESRGPPYRQLSPELARAPAPIVPSQMRSPPLPRKPIPVGAGIRSPMAVKRPLPPPPDTDSFYEPIEDADSTDDEEWKTEELRDYHIYNQ
ncbi:hypothetical protein O0L34_g12162 [Tuta absoluta]|nr:hypothetical protein O0L34_g12162 [Tuta absoluta]